MKLAVRSNLNTCFHRVSGSSPKIASHEVPRHAGALSKVLCCAVDGRKDWRISAFKDEAFRGLIMSVRPSQETCRLCAWLRSRATDCCLDNFDAGKSTC